MITAVTLDQIGALSTMIRVNSQQVKIPKDLAKLRLGVKPEDIEIYIEFGEDDGEFYFRKCETKTASSIRFKRQKTGDFYNHQSAVVRYLRNTCDCYDAAFSIKVGSPSGVWHCLIKNYHKTTK